MVKKTRKAAIAAQSAKNLNHNHRDTSTSNQAASRIFHYKTTTLLLRFSLFIFTIFYVGIRITWYKCFSIPHTTSCASAIMTEESIMCKTAASFFTLVGFVTPNATNDICKWEEEQEQKQKQDTPVIIEITKQVPVETTKKVNFLKRIMAKIKKGGKNKTRIDSPSQKESNTDTITTTATTAILEYPNAYTTIKPLTDAELHFIQALSKQVHEVIPDLESRAAAVAWGGDKNTLWWQEDATLYAYGKIMKWPTPDLRTTFPFKLCSKGCDAHVAIAHTLEFREKFKPWLVSPNVIHENRNGYIYFRGYSPTPQGDNTGHTMVWFRPGHHKLEDPVLYFRAILNTLERAVADNLLRSNGKIGKFNVVMNTQGLTFSMLTSFGHVQRAIVMLQDHFPDRLGMIFLANLSKPAEFLLNLIKRVITKEVGDKIVILSSDPHLRKVALEAVTLPQFIPSYLGGTDNLYFDSDQYYPKKYHCTNEEAIEYIQTMPYHAT